MPLARRARRTIDIWPGFVDALATLVMVIVFVLMIFVLAQYFLGQALSGRQKALDRLSQEMAALSESLNMQKAANAALQAELVSSKADKERVEAWAAGLGQDVTALMALKDELEARIKELDKTVGAKDGELVSERKLSEEARAQAALLSRQMEAMKQELARISAALDASETRDKEQKAQIADLGKRLNVALAGKVEELQKYRSEFFGRLRKVLGERPGIRIEGDRFVFQSELLFDSGSAELGLDGIEQVRNIAATLKDIAKTMPKGVNWVLRVDGHTDKRPITSAKFPSNWELSTARATTVLRTLAASGVPKDRLAAAGFGEFQPLDTADTDAAFARNRRIEIRFDQR
ncbi:flagellar motor protein MotB [Paramagnetospirillum kuznetsovii]|uniref:Flagellar motor protein MotB n=1 Tax=Paramagnetospirillum kuznetsovii TaxID=2053833 RepID=A0A364NTK9_9PROT|nr:peptidoglycan -binding protein [Paramagnetospirillum kuznetsovii]RAU20411.1 flagellar motor protein MotB [Paramagnetospirillum kuznetsovii]